MSLTDKYSYDLVSCDTGSYPTITNLCTAVNPSPFNGLVVSILGQPESQIYTVSNQQLNSVFCAGFMPTLSPADLSSCADPNVDKLFRISNCADPKERRDVLLAATYAIGTVLRFTGECTCWVVELQISTYDENPTVDQDFMSCAECIGQVVSELCTYEERTIGHAVKITPIKPEPPNRGFDECCYSNVVFGDVSDSDPYKNDFYTVFYKRQTPNDTVTFEIVGATSGVTALVDATHGVEYPFNSVGQPDLTYFKVEWRKILSVIGLDIYTIRMNISVGGIAATAVDTFTFDLRPFSQAAADNTVRIDCKMDGMLQRIDVDFKNSGMEQSLRVEGYFGDEQDQITQDNLVVSSKKGQSYFSNQLTMSNDIQYTYQAIQLPVCLSDVLRKFIIWGNEIFISDYNLNNHSYRYELLPVELVDKADNNYRVKNRLVDLDITFADRSKDNRKTNC